MSGVALPTPSVSPEGTAAEWPRRRLPYVFAAIAFGVLFAHPFVLLLDDWWNNPEAGHGLLLAPAAVWLAWRSRRGVATRPAPVLGGAVLLAAVLIRYLSSLAAELYTMRMSMLLALAGLVLFFGGLARLRAWWLPAALLVLAVPLPEVIIGSIARPLQLQASEMGAALLRVRSVPVRLDGNLILLPGHQLFVTEACSGLRSLTALLSLGFLAGGLWLRLPVSRALLVAGAIPVAVLLNGVRVFLTGFLVYFIDPQFGEGFMHLTEGWLMFLVAFGLLFLLALSIAAVERRFAKVIR